jgi:uncharacterized OB-fold protein
MMMTEKVPIGYKCMNCEKIHYPRHGRCLNCKHSEFNEIELPSQGTLITYTILKAPPTGIDKFSIILGIIDLGDVRYTGQLEIDSNDLKTGMAVRARWTKVRELDGKVIHGFVWEKA